MKKKILIVVGTRPNFIKVTQFKKEVNHFPNLEIILLHTGQHYDQNMSDVFFDQFNLIPDYFLNSDQSSVNSQMADIIKKTDEIVEEISPEMILAVGDVNSTLCAALVANKRGILLGHIESGLRSRDRSMPEEINRILTDEITDHFFVTEDSGIENLRNEGKPEETIHFVGNTMIDTLIAFSEQVDQSKILAKHALTPEQFVLVTMHRPSNVDGKESLSKVIELIEKIAKLDVVVFPVHPRTINQMKKYDLYDRFKKIVNTIRLEPLDYFSFQKLIASAKVVITDSGGIQEETTFKQIPCLTIRNNTERPSTIEIGSNELHPFEVDAIVELVNNGRFKKGKIPKFWDGKSTHRILKVIDQVLAGKKGTASY